MSEYVACETMRQLVEFKSSDWKVASKTAK